MIEVATRKAPALLEICIPTYGRADVVRQSIISILECSDDRYRVSVSSNKQENSLAEFLKHKKNVKYHSFYADQGFTINVKWLLANADARHVLLLSDEDTISPDQLKRLLDYLEGDNGNPIIYYIPCTDKFSLGNLLQLKNMSLSFRNVMMIAPMGPTYMSGYIFPACQITDENLNQSFENHFANAYPFIILRNLLLKSGSTFKILSDITISRGPEIEFGGSYLSDIATKERLPAKKLEWRDISDKSFPTSAFETSERFTYFNIHLRELYSRNVFLYIYSLGLIANRMRSGTGARISVSRIRSGIRGSNGPLVIFSMAYLSKSKNFWHFRSLFFRTFQYMIQKSSGIVRLILSWRPAQK